MLYENLDDLPAASPPVHARWSKVIESGITLTATGLSFFITTRSMMRPAPTIATCGGETTGVANNPEIEPKLDRVIVAFCKLSLPILRSLIPFTVSLSQLRMPLSSN